MKRGNYILGFFLIIVLTLSFVSAGSFGNFWDKITGKATTQNVGLNITVTSGRAPVIIDVYDGAMTGGLADGPNEGPSSNPTTIVFAVQDQDGIGNINNATAVINYSKSGETTRQSSACTFLAGNSTATTANYSCTVTMWWYDGPGAWAVNAYIVDANANSAYNTSGGTFTMGSTDGLLANQSTINWSSINPGATNTEALQFMGLNNTGNAQKSLYVNASDLLGETTPSKALGANNFSVKNAAGCEGTLMVNRTDTNVTSAQLPRGNYTLNDGTGQANLYYCLETSNADLTAQAYSTKNTGAWIVKVGA